MVSPVLAWGNFHARSRFARSTIPEEKWGTTRSLPPQTFLGVRHAFLPHVGKRKGNLTWNVEIWGGGGGKTM